MTQKRSLLESQRIKLKHVQDVSKNEANNLVGSLTLSVDVSSQSVSISIIAPYCYLLLSITL